MTHVVTDNCRHCRYTECVVSCPVACFHINEVRVYINPDVCVDCGACVAVCPVEAIFEDIDLSEDQSHWIDINAKAVNKYPLVQSRLDALPDADKRRTELGF